jgi:hypothetical protein
MAAPRAPFNVTALNIEVPADGQREVTFSVATGVLDDTWTVAIAGTTVAEGDGTDSFVAVFPASADGQRWQLSHEGIERVAGVVIPRPLRNALDLTTLELTVDDGGTVIGIEVVAVGPVGPPGVVAATGIATYDDLTQTIDVPMPTAADVGAATAAQGATADTAVQPGDLASVATTGDYNDLTGKPTGGGSSDAITVPDGTMAFIGAYYPPASAHLTDHLDSIDDAFVGAAQAIVAVGAASIGTSQKGAPNGVAELDGSGLVLSSQLPSYVDDVTVVADYAALPGTGADGKIYVTSDTNLTYRWTGSAYTEISKSLALGTTSSTAYRGDHGAATAAGLADGSGVSDPAAFRGNLGLGAIATQPVIYRTDIATGAINAALLDPALAAEIAAAVPNGTTVEATSDLTRTSTTGPADGVLEFTAAADTSYRIDAYLIFQGDATADLKLGFTMPAGTMHLTVEGALTTVASSENYDRFLTLTASAATTVVGIAGASTPISVRISGVIRPTSAGTVALVWAPNATGAGTGVTRLARSQIYYRAV